MSDQQGGNSERPHQIRRDHRRVVSHSADSDHRADHRVVDVIWLTTCDMLCRCLWQRWPWRLQLKFNSSGRRLHKVVSRFSCLGRSCLIPLPPGARCAPGAVPALFGGRRHKFLRRGRSWFFVRPTGIERHSMQPGLNLLSRAIRNRTLCPSQSIQRPSPTLWPLRRGIACRIARQSLGTLQEPHPVAALRPDHQVLLKETLLHTARRRNFSARSTPSTRRIQAGG